MTPGFAGPRRDAAAGLPVSDSGLIVAALWQCQCHGHVPAVPPLHCRSAPGRAATVTRATPRPGQHCPTA